MRLTGERMAVFSVLAMIFLIPHHAAAQNCTTVRLQFQDLSYRGFSRLSGDTGSIEPLYDMVNRYLDAVQPNNFPTEIINGVRDTNFVSQNYEQLLRYGAGYLVSFIIGVLFFIIMPLVGLFFCCCRCCNNCGGHVKERTKATDCQRRTLGIFLLMTTIIILAGVACAFTANQKVTDAMDPSVASINATLADTISYINNISETVPKIVAQFSVPRNRLLSELDSIDGTLGRPIKEALDPIVDPVLMMLFARLQELRIVKGHLSTINATQSSVRVQQLQLQAELENLKLDIIATLENASCENCLPAVAAVNNLELKGILRKPTEIQVVLDRFVITTDILDNSVEQGYRLFNETPARVNNRTSQIIKDIKIAIKDIEGNLSTITEKIQLPDVLQSLPNTLNSQQVAGVTSEVKRYDNYRWIVGIVLCCIILLILACNVLGLGLGTAGIAIRDDPYSATGCSKSGANFLMAGVGFSFIFSWLLILLVFVTFLVGGNVRTVLCKPWETGEIYQIIDTLATQDKTFNLSNYLNVSISISELHRRCENDESLWNILSLNQIVDLDSFLNLSTYTGDVVQINEGLNVDLSDVVLLDSAGRNALRNAGRTGIDGINYTLSIEQVNEPLLKANLLDLANILESLLTIQIGVIRSNLNRQAQKLRELQNTSVNALQQDLVLLNTSFQFLAGFAPSIQNVINNTSQKIDRAQEEIISTTQRILKSVSDCLTTKELGYVEQYLQWARTTIIDDLLSCQPAVIIIDNFRVIICEFVTDPWNAFWFCLGWCTLFLIPSIIFAVKTAKHYRPIKNKASSPERSEMAHFKFPRVQNTYGPPVHQPVGPAGAAR
uniref:prominin-2-like n=1 Tax=Pristiophorus japonicus TaxID=55135 RepID=UPI00398F4042